MVVTTRLTFGSRRIKYPHVPLIKNQFQPKHTI